MSKATILVIEDNQVNRYLLTSYLTGIGYLVLNAENGQDGIATALAKQPQLILLDVMMPGINGFETAKRLKAMPETQEIPIIYISALDQLSDKLTGFAAGGVDYITKPFNFAEILARVEIHLSIYNLQRELSAKNEALAAANDKITDLNNRLYELFGRFATQPVADELLAHGFALGGSHVEATAMFSDIRDFTHITKTQGPAVTIQLLNDYFAYMIDAIGKEGGIVNQMVGDGLMAIFGAPLPHEDHAQRAVQAAIRMRRCIKTFNQKQLAHGRVPIEIGIGIASGPVIAGYLGTQIRATYTCVGDTVNLAARLEEHTKQVPYSVLIDQQTRQALDPAIPVKDLGILNLKGTIQEQNIFAVLIDD
ncbi:MAG: response regulator [Anaerolineales bacterium]|nr:response regulator [Anaerolineales bacterium]